MLTLKYYAINRERLLKDQILLRIGLFFYTTVNSESLIDILRYRCL
jgi:hypothetical protein